MNRASPDLPKIPLIFLSLGGVLLALLTFLPNSATAIWMIRWYPLHISALLLMALGFGLWVLSSSHALGRSQKILLTFLNLMFLGVVASAYTGPFTARAMIYSFPLLTGLFCGCCLLIVGHRDLFEKLFAQKGFQGGIALFVVIFCGISLQRFITQDVLPLLSLATELDTLAEGGLKGLILMEEVPEIRNAAPFGHPNYTSGFLLLLLPLLFHGICRPVAKHLRTLSLFALALGVFVLLSTQSRNAVLGMVAGGMIYAWWSKGTRRLPWKLVAGSGCAGLLIFFLVPRFQVNLLSVSPARWGIWKTAYLTGLEYFPFGSGEGLAPEMLQRFAPQLESVWPNSMQFHHTWLHLWAVGGILAFVGIGGLTLWLLAKAIFPASEAKEDRKFSSPSLMALAATFVVFCADYQLDIIQMGLLLFFHVAVVVSFHGKPLSEASKLNKLFFTVPLLALLLSISFVPASIRSRRVIDDAGWAYEQHKNGEAVDNFLKAYDYVPEPYALNMAGVILTQSHNSHSQAIEVFEKSLELWEAQTLVHEFLTYLYTHEADEIEDTSQKVDYLETALHHATRRAQLAPQLTGSYLDLASIQQRMGADDEVIIDSLVKELLLQGDLLFPAVWEVLGELQPYRESVWKRVLTAEAPESPALQSQIEVCRSWLGAMELLPENRTVSEEVSLRFDTQMSQTTSLKLLKATCEATPDQKIKGLHRFLLFVYKQAISETTAEALWLETQGPDKDCVAELLKAGRARAPRGSFAGVGITARHPLTIPVWRPRLYPTVLGADVFPNRLHKTFKPGDL